MTDKRVSLTSRRMPHLEISRQVLAETRSEAQAALLAARVQARYDELYAHRPSFDHPALRRHLETTILPGLALYQILREENDDQKVDDQKIMAEIDRFFTAKVEHAGQLLQIIRHLPGLFTILRIANRRVLKRMYPPEGWRFEWVEDSDQCIAYDARECFYVNVLTDYDAPELTAHFCRTDDLLYSSLPGIVWGRTKTLGRGDDRCNFRFCRANSSSALKEQP